MIVTLEVYMPDRLQLQYPTWQESYLSAMMEIDSAKLKLKIAAAESNIRIRTIEMPESYEERQAIFDAVNGLRSLTRCG
jgi:hypothetical protein